MANALVKDGREMLALIPPRGSVAAAVQAAPPGQPGCGGLPPPSGLGNGRPRIGVGSRCAGVLGPPGGDGRVRRAGRADAGAAAARRRKPEPGRRHRGLHRRLYHLEHPAQGALDAEDWRASSGAAVRHGSEGGGGVRARAAGDDVLVRHHPLRRRPPRPCRRLPVLRHAAAAPAGRRPRDEAGAQRHRRRRRHPAQGTRARRALPRPGGRGDGALRRRDGPAEPPAGVLRAPGHLGDLGDPLADRRRARGRPRLRVRRLGVLQRGDLPASSGASAGSGGTTCWRSPPSRAAGPTTRTSATRSTSCCGSHRCPTSRPGSRAGGRVGRAGTSSARPWRCASSARRSTSTEEGAISCSRTTSARRPSPSR